MSDVTKRMIRQENFSIVICGHVDSGTSTTTGRLLFELGGIPEFELDKLTQEAERLEKSPFAFVFCMDRQKEVKKRGVIIACNMEFFTGSGRITTTGRLLSELGCISERKLDELKQDPEHLEKSSLVCTFFMVRQKEEWERGANMTAGASRSSTLLRMEQTYNDVNKIVHDTAGYGQEWCEETSNEMKNILIKG